MLSYDSRSTLIRLDHRRKIGREHAKAQSLPCTRFRNGKNSVSKFRFKVAKFNKIQDDNCQSHEAVQVSLTLYFFLEPGRFKIGAWPIIRLKTRPIFFLRSSRIRVDLLSYESIPTDKREHYDWRAEKIWTGKVAPLCCHEYLLY